MPEGNGAASSLGADGSWIVRRYPVADSTFVNFGAGLWQLKIETSRPPLATSDIAAVLEGVIGPLRRLDDSEGGSAASVGMVQDQLDIIDAYLTKGHATNVEVGHRLIRASAQLNQLAGWMAFDSERHATAQRYFRAGLRAARDIDDNDLAAYILACMACHMAYRRQFAEAIQISDAAMRAARDSHPAVRSVIASQAANVQAAAGDRNGFQAAAECAQQLWAIAGGADPKPDFLYWYDQDYLDFQRSASAQLLAFELPHQDSDILSEADELLHLRIRRYAATMPRNAALHSAGLARTYVQRGEIDRAVSSTELAIEQLPPVRSRRVCRVLRSVKADLLHSGSARREPKVQWLCQQIRCLIT